MTDNKLLVPMAIVVAGAMVAGAIYLGGDRSPRSNPGNTGGSTVAIDLSPVTSDDYIRGSRNAPIILVEYSDIECPFCKVFHGTMKNIVSSYDGQVSWIYRHFPIPQLHQKAISEAVATECAAEQGGNDIFWAYLDRVFEATNSNDSLDLAELPKIANALGLDVSSFNQCISSGKYDEKIRENMEDAQRIGARGTPYSVLVLDKALSKTQVAGLLDINEEIKKASRSNQDALMISTDKKRVALGGALPLDLMKEILDAILK